MTENPAWNPSSPDVFSKISRSANFPCPGDKRDQRKTNSQWLALPCAVKKCTKCERAPDEFSQIASLLTRAAFRIELEPKVRRAYAPYNLQIVEKLVTERTGNSVSPQVQPTARGTTIYLSIFSRIRLIESRTEGLGSTRETNTLVACPTPLEDARTLSVPGPRAYDAGS
jgi:hypothetical protein